MRSNPHLVTLRLAQLSDVAACGALDGSYSADHTWQLSQERPLFPGAPELSVALRGVRLPRPRSVTVPDPTPQLEAEWDSTDLFLVAEVDQVAGYACASIQDGAARLDRLLVDTPYRRRGVATELLGAVRAWAHENGLRCIVAAAPAKNYPAITLLRSRGYRICGYNERQFASGEIALYLAQDLPSG
ncbi:MAG: GNAT family N-acetyltransferase [Chloroflexota bacterium]|nr:GNAT family N-acetyltransferase [Chloroflexota bacterium]